MPNTITLKGTPIQKEAFANAALVPGHLLELLSTGKVQKQSNATDQVPNSFALEKEYDGKDLNSPYAADDTVLYGVFSSGSEVLAVLAASAPAIVIGDLLEPAADGTVRKQVTPGDPVLAIAIEAVDNSGGGTEVPIQIEIL